MALFYYKEKKNKGIRAAAYLRLSIEDGDKVESNSIGNQRELIQNFVAERPELHLVGEYADDGYTGTNFERPGFTQMMEDIQSDKINCIIVKDLSRLGRNYQNLTSLNRRVLVELVESITVYDKEHIHIQYRFDQEIRNVLEYCNSVLTTETEEGAV